MYTESSKAGDFPGADFFGILHEHFFAALVYVNK